MLLVAAMAAATLPASVMGIVATFVIDDLEISRSQLGLALTVNVVAAAVLSPAVGRVTDRIGGRRALISVFATAAAGFAIVAGAPGYPVLLVGAAVAAIGQAFGNPSTNKLIAAAIPAGRRGYITGVKQSGVQVAVFVGGLTLPSLATRFGWRPTLGLLGAIALIGAMAAATLRRDRTTDRAIGPPQDSRTVSMRWLATYGALLGFGGAATFFFALFVEEGLGGTPRQGGAVVAVSGFVAVCARIGLARFAERRNAFGFTLGAIALGSVLSVGVMAAASAATWLVWVGAALFGLSAASWNSVGMLAVISQAGPLHAGRASGLVMMGFLGGLGIAPPIYGRIADVTGSYDTMWAMCAVAFALGLVTILVWRRADHVRDSGP